MGEGLACGFEAVDKGHVMGTQMGRLSGAVWSFDLTSVDYGYQFPAERVFLLGGTPREHYHPTQYFIPTTNDKDELMEKALSLFK